MLKDRPITLSEEQVDELARRLMACIEQADLDLATYNDAVDTGRDYFVPEPERTDSPWEGASDITVPACEATLLQQRARIDNSLLCVNPIVRVEAPNKVIGGDVESFLQRFLTEEVRFRSKFLAAVDSALQDGSSCLYITWREEYRKETRWVTQDVEVPIGTRFLLPDVNTGEVTELTEEEAAQWEYVQPGMVQREPAYRTESQRFGTEEEVASFDGPHYLLVETGYVPGTNKARWGTYPAADGNLQESTGVFVRYSLTGEEINQRVHTGDFDGDAVERLRVAGGTQDNLETAEDAQEAIGAENVADETFQWKSYNLVDLYWRVVPVPDSDEGETEAGKRRRERARAQDYLITIDEQARKVLRCRPNPWWHGKRPFVLVRPLRKRFGVHGVSTPNLAGPAQKTMQQVLRDSFDTAQKRIKPPKKVRRGLLAFREREELELQDKPGGLFEVDYPESIQVMSEGIGDPNAGVALLDIAERWRQMNTGVNEQSAGLIRGRATATEVQVANAEGDALFRHILQNVAEDIEEAVRLTLSLCYQHIDHSSVQKAWLAANPKSSVQEPDVLPGELELSPEQALVVHAWGTTETSNNAVKRMVWESGLPILLSLPELQVPPEVMVNLPEDIIEALARRQYAAHRAFVSSRPLGDTEELLGTEDDYLKLVFALVQVFQQQRAEMQQMQQQGNELQMAQEEMKQQGKLAQVAESGRNRMQELQVQGMLESSPGGSVVERR